MHKIRQYSSASRNFDRFFPLDNNFVRNFIGG